MQPLRIALMGFGATGQEIGRLIADRGSELALVAVADRAPARVGTEVRPGLAVTDAIATSEGIDLVVVTTTSRLSELEGQINPWLDAGVDVVSIAEELGHPWRSQPELSARLDTRARAGGATLLGCGANPGFVMDMVPLALSGALPQITRIAVTRTIDLADYGDLVWRFGLGTNPDVFAERMALGEITGHVGFAESIGHLAHVARIPLDEVTVSRPRPVVVTEGARHGEHHSLPPHTVAAIEQVGCGLVDGDEVIELHEFFAFRPHAGEVPAGDSWTLSCSDRELRVVCPAGIPSLGTTAALTVNVLTAVVAQPAGLRTMSDMPVAAFAATYRP